MKTAAASILCYQHSNSFYALFIETTMDQENMETIVLAAIFILMVVFIGSLFALIIICLQRRNYLTKKDFFGKHFSHISDNQPDNAYLIVANNSNNNKNGQLSKGKRSQDCFTENHNNMELDDVRLHPNIDQILSDTQWVDDATGLIPHCLAVLKGCHHLTERLVAATMSAMPRFTEQDQRLKLAEIGRIAPTISPRVDDVVEAMYPPLDPRLLESRCLSLLLCVSRLAIVVTYTCSIRGQWIDDEIKGLEMQLKILRDAGQALIKAEMNCSTSREEEMNSTISTSVHITADTEDKTTEPKTLKT